MAENKRPPMGPPKGGPGGRGPKGGFQKPKDLKTTITKLMRYLGRDKLHLCIVAVLLVVSSVCSVGGSFLIKPLINDYILPGDFPGLARMLAFMALVYVTGAACSYGYARIMVHVSQNTMARIREELFEKMQRLPLKYFDTHTHGELMSRYTNDIETVSEALNNSFGSLISCTLNFVGTVTMMLVLSPVLTLVTFGMMVVMRAILLKSSSIAISICICAFIGQSSASNCSSTQAVTVGILSMVASMFISFIRKPPLD